MGRWWRRIRGALGLGAIWAGVWLGAGLVLLLIVGPDAADVPFPLFFGLLGFLSGILFSGILGLVDGQRSFEEMSMGRFATLGGLGGVVLSVGLSAIVGWQVLPLLAVVFAVSGAGCAAGSLGLARMAEDGDTLERLPRDPGAQGRSA